MDYGQLVIRSQSAGIFLHFFLLILPSSALTIRFRACFNRMSLNRSKSVKLARVFFRAIPLAKSEAANLVAISAAKAFLTVPGRAPTEILIERSVNWTFLTETVYRLRAPSSTRSRLRSMTLVTAQALLRAGTKTTPPMEMNSV